MGPAMDQTVHGNGGESSAPPPAPRQKPQEYIVRFGAMRYLGNFRWHKPEQLSWGTNVLVRTERGVETGVVLRPNNSGRTRVPADYLACTKGTILRVMTDADWQIVRRNAEREKKDFQICQQCIEAAGLPMKLVRVERLFGGERAIVYYTAERRVDFRELVRQLARRLGIRVEMRQIGVRDEARLLADYGDCGQPVCCRTHLVIIPPISMQMAKLQRSTLDPTKISGRCGRLKCCLRFEFQTYEEALRRCPPIGARVSCAEGVGTVVGQELLQEQIWVEIEGRGRKLIPAAESQVLELPTREEAAELSEEGILTESYSPATEVTIGEPDASFAGEEAALTESMLAVEDEAYPDEDPSQPAS